MSVDDNINLQSSEFVDDDPDNEELDLLKEVGFDFTSNNDLHLLNDKNWRAFTTLSQRQANVVKRRLSSLKKSPRKLNRDVRTIFPPSPSSVRHTRSSPLTDPPQQCTQYCNISKSSATSVCVTCVSNPTSTPDSLLSCSPTLIPSSQSPHIRLSSSPFSQGYCSSSRDSLHRISGSTELVADSFSTSPRPLADHAPLATDTDVHGGTHSSLDTCIDQLVTCTSKLMLSEPLEVNAARLKKHSKSTKVYRQKLSGFVSSCGSKHNLLSASLDDLSVDNDIFDSAVVEECRSASQENYVTESYCTEFTDADLGDTLIDDLSQRDAEIVQKLSCLELTALYDENDMTYSHRKYRQLKRAKPARLYPMPSLHSGSVLNVTSVSPTNPTPHGPPHYIPSSTDSVTPSPFPDSDEHLPVFGVPLDLLMLWDTHMFLPAPQSLTPVVPEIAEMLLCLLERRSLLERGILRVSGNSQRVAALRECLDRYFYRDHARALSSVSAVTGPECSSLLKCFLRELPTTLLTGHLLDAFVKTSRLATEPHTQQLALRLLCLQLPASHRALLLRLLQFLARVVSHCDNNLMTLENVATIMAPNIIHTNGRKLKDITSEVAFATSACKVLMRLIDIHCSLCSVPANFVRQLRHRHELEMYGKERREMYKPIDLLRRRKPLKIVRKVLNEVDFQNSIIRITALQFNIRNLAVKLTSKTTPSKLIQKFWSQTAYSDGAEVHSAAGSLNTTFECCYASISLQQILKTHYIYEHGGNIDQRRLDHSCKLLHCYRQNPNGQWMLKCCHPRHLETCPPPSPGQVP